MADAQPTADTELETLTQFLYVAPIGLVQATADGEILMVNPMSAQLLLPLSRDGELANLFEVLRDVAPDLRHRAQHFAPAQGLVCDSVHLPVRAGASGRGEPQTLSLSLLKLDGTRLMAVINDVSAAVARERALRGGSAWLDGLVAGIGDYALMSLDRDGAVHGWNDSVGRVTGFDALGIVGHSYAALGAGGPLADERARDRLDCARRTGWSLDEGWRLRADGTRYWGSCLIAPLDLPREPAPGEPAYSLILRDVSAHRHATDALRRAATCDELTGLANRNAFFDVAAFERARWLRAPRPAALVLVEADHFKNLADTRGRAAGDAVLRHLAVSLQAHFREAEVIARIGGERFAVLLAGLDAAAAHAAAARWCDGLAHHPAEVDGVAIACGASAGVTAFAPEADDVDTLLQRAGAALRLAQAAGGNRAVCEAADAAGAVGQPLAACEGLLP